MTKPTTKIPSKFPRWASGAGTTLEPSEGRKDTGWIPTDKPAARHLNWLLNTNYEFQKRLAGAVFGNITNVTIPTATSLIDMVYQKETNLWMAVETGVGGNVFVSNNDGGSWTNVRTLTDQTKKAGASAANNTSIMVGTGNNSLEYSSDGQGAVWAIDNPGSFQDILTIDTKPGSTFTAIGGGQTTTSVARIAYAAGGPGTAWSISNLPIGLNSPIRSLRYLGGSTWIAVTFSGIVGQERIILSTDDCVNFSSVSSFSTMDTGAVEERHIGVNTDTGRIIVTGNVGSPDVLTLAWSDDGGYTWTVDAQNVYDRPLGTAFNERIYGIYYLGSDMWILGGFNLQSPGSVPALISIDNGESWSPVSLLNDPVASTTYGIGCNGRKVMFAALNALWTSLGIPGSLNE